MIYSAAGAEVVSVRCTNLMQSSMKILWWGFVPYYWEYTGHPRNALQVRKIDFCFAENLFSTSPTCALAPASPLPVSPAC